MADIIVNSADFVCGCGYKIFGLFDVDGSIVCPSCGKLYEIVCYLVPDDEDEEEGCE